MINLKEKYGNKIFNRKKLYSLTLYANYILTLFYSFLFSLLIVIILDIEWNYAILKVFIIILAFDLLREIMKWPFSWLQYKFFSKPVIAEEMRHYLNVLTSEGVQLSDGNSSTYDDFLLFSAYAPILSVDMRVMSAINYGVVGSLYSTAPNMEDRYYNIWCGVVTDYMERNPDKFSKDS